jgi:hypothetical protein
MTQEEYRAAYGLCKSNNDVLALKNRVLTENRLYGVHDIIEHSGANGTKTILRIGRWELEWRTDNVMPDIIYSGRLLTKKLTPKGAYHIVEAGQNQSVLIKKCED